MKKIILKYSLFLVGLILFAEQINAQQVIISDAAGFSLGQVGTVDINADLINNSPNSVFGGTFIFSGSAEHEIGGTAPVNFVNLTINNESGIKITNDIAVSGNLNLLAGTVYLLNNNITIGSAATLTGDFSSTIMIVADSAGQFKREISGTGTYLFPVGDTSGIVDYSPVSLSFTSGNFSDAIVGINLKNKKHPQNTSVNDYLNKYWIVSQNGISDFSCNLIFTYSNEDIVGNVENLWGAKWDGSQWTMLNQASFNQFSGTVNSFSEFTAGEKSVLSTVDKLSDDDVEIIISGDNIIIRSDNIQFDRAEIYNLSGQLIYSKDLFEQTINELNFYAHPNYYIVKVYAGKQSISKKIFKQ